MEEINLIKEMIGNQKEDQWEALRDKHWEKVKLIPLLIKIKEVVFMLREKMGINQMQFGEDNHGKEVINGMKNYYGDNNELYIY